MSNMYLLEQMRGSRKNPSVLKHKIISIRSVKPDELIFVFEGDQDVGVYESWISATTARPIYEPVAGKGKEQLLALHRQFKEDEDNLLRRVFFFVDCDFDPATPEGDHVFILNAYSIENLLCDVVAIDSLVQDEFRCAGSPAERMTIRNSFEVVTEKIEQCLRELNFKLFAARRTGLKIIKKPEDITKLIEVRLSSASSLTPEPETEVKLEQDLDPSLLVSLRQEFDNLPTIRKQRGKYVLAATREWLRRLTEDRKSEMPLLFIQPLRNLPGEPCSISLRRLAIAATMPDGLDEFISAAQLAA